MLTQASFEERKFFATTQLHNYLSFQNLAQSFPLLPFQALKLP